MQLRILNVIAFCGLLTATARAADYQIAPLDKSGWAQSTFVCSTPRGWQGWKDDPHYWEGMSPETRGEYEEIHQMSVVFYPTGTDFRSKHPNLFINVLGPMANQYGHLKSVSKQFHAFLSDLMQNQGPHDPPPTVGKFAESQMLGQKVTIWSIRCSFCSDYLIAMCIRDDTLITVGLSAEDMKELVAKAGGLTELMSSVRVAGKSGR